VGGNIKLDLTEIEWGGMSAFIRLWIGTSDGSCEYGNKTLSSIRLFKFLSS
jgi:hypothetical protein